MFKKSVVLGAVAYILGTFPIAYVWHLVIFEERYRAFGYFDDEPNVLLGFISIVIQGVTLSFLYQHTRFNGGALVQAAKFACVIGVFFWTSHVLAFLAKQLVQDSVAFAIMETGYLAIQFGAFGLLLGLINRNRVVSP